MLPSIGLPFFRSLHANFSFLFSPLLRRALQRRVGQGALPAVRTEVGLIRTVFFDSIVIRFRAHSGGNGIRSLMPPVVPGSVWRFSPMKGCLGPARRCLAFFSSATFALFALAASTAVAQSTPTREWVWQGGDTTVAHAPVFGRQGMAAAGNTPGSRYAASSWTDASGNFWLFGGYGYTWNGNFSALNDLWMYGPTTGQWTWINGGNQFSPNGVYGTTNTPDPGNFPSIRAGAAAWTDKSGNFWMFGGEGADSTGTAGYLNDLWEFNPSSTEWTWVGGPNTIACATENNATVCGNAGVYGMQGTPASGDTPGGRELSSVWIDASGNFWLFGGQGLGADVALGSLNDLWDYNPSTGSWTYVIGSMSVNVAGQEGELGMPAPGNVPASRAGAANWTDQSGDLWLFGGATVDLGTETNDLWEFNPGTTEWTWWGGVYGTLASQPPLGIRQEPTSWTDGNGNFWIFGGAFFEYGSCGEGCYVDRTDYDYDVWEYTPPSNTWTEVSGRDSLICSFQSGSATCEYAPGEYGTYGHPGGRSSSASWTDTNGNFWLYGGYGIDSAGMVGPLSDFWMSAPPAPAPTFNPAAGSYTGMQSVTISDSATGATIYYTTDGTKPSSNSNLYTGPVALSQAVVQLQAMATAPEYGPSPIASASYSLTLPTAASPQFSPAAGTYRSRQTVTITSSTPGATIYYSINSSPTTASTVYTGPITVSQPETIEAFAIAPGYSNSLEASASYSIATTTSTLGFFVDQYPDTFDLSCKVTGAQISGAKGPTGTVQFTDVTMGRTLGSFLLNVPVSQPANQFLTSQVGKNPVALVEGDFNNDGIADVAVANANDGTVSILLGNGDSTFQQQVAYPVGTNPVALVVGKFNKDANLDLAVLNAGSSNITILLGNGDGTFTTGSSSPSTGSGSTQILAGDFNNDGMQDLAVVGMNSSNQGTISIFLGNGDGTFQAAKVTTLSTPVLSAVAGKFAGSGNLDLITVGGETSSVLSLLAGNGDGTFSVQPIAAGTQIPAQSSEIATGDFNDDGIPDLVVTGESALGFMVELLGNGDGTFQYSPGLMKTIPYAFTPAGIVVDKFNGDRGDDIAIANGTGLNNGYQEGPSILVYSSAGLSVYFEPGLLTGVAAANFGGNGNPTEFLTANAGPNSSTVTLAVPAAQEVAAAGGVLYTVPPGTMATHNFECSYSGDANYSASTSNPVSWVYTPAEPPVFSLLVGAYAGAQPVQIADTSYKATIYYTTDGSDPTTSSTVYTGPVTLTATTKLKAIAGGGYLSSLISEAVYTITGAPIFSASGSGTASMKVTLSDATPGATILYTTDGSVPSIYSSVYKGAITLTKETTIKAFAATAGQINSPLVTQTFNVTTPSVPNITWPAPEPIKYGTVLSSLQLSASTATAGTFKYAPGMGAMLEAWPHKLTVTFTPTEHAHFATTTKSVFLLVFKKALIVAAPKVDKVYGAEMPKIGYKITGLVNGDKLGKAVTGAPVVSTSATVKSSVGSYPIKVTVGTLEAANYLFELSQGNVTITKAPLHVRANNLTMTQGAQVPALTYVIAPFVNGDRIKTATTGTPKIATTATSNSKPGTYPITASAGTLKAENYAITYINGTMTVTP